MQENMKFKARYINARGQLKRFHLAVFRAFGKKFRQIPFQWWPPHKCLDLRIVIQECVRVVKTEIVLLLEIRLNVSTFEY